MTFNTISYSSSDDQQLKLISSMVFVILSTAALIITFSAAIAQETECFPNAVKSLCGQECEAKCHAPLPANCSGLTCEDPPTCGCIEGFARDPDSNHCVAIHACPVNECDVGEFKGACGRTCEGTCIAPFEPEICSRIRCAGQSCRCDLYGGFVRNVDGRCVRKHEC